MERRGAAIPGARPLSAPPSFHIQERKRTELMKPAASDIRGR